MADDVRRFVTTLAGIPDRAVRDLLTRRSVSPNVSWRDPFDAAEALLEPASVRQALAQLDAGTAAVLAALVTVRDDAPTATDAQRDHLIGLGLIDADGAAYEAVRAAVAQLPAPPQLPAAPAPVDSAAAAERAFRTAGTVGELLIAWQARPLALIGTGALSATERRRLVESGILESADQLDAFVWLTQAAGLTRAHERALRATEQAQIWLEQPSILRWQALRDGFTAARPNGIAGDGGLLAAADWSGAYPWDAMWPDTAAAWIERAQLLGLLDAAGAPTLWATGDASSLEAHLPAEVDRVFLQNDLSVIAPGPLAPALDLRLRRSARRESHSQASTYRFTPDSVAGGLTHGETEQSLLEFLGELSLTGIPQPLTYLIADAAGRHGSIRVGVDAASGRTRIITATDALRETLAIDQSLRPLGLVPDETGLTTRVGRDAVAVALADAKYPVALMAEDGSLEPVSGVHVAPQEPSTAPDFSELIARLRPDDQDDLARAWLIRELESAVRERATMRVTVRMGEDERTFLLEAAGYGAGRLRGLDRASDVERTLPVSHIVHAERV